MISIRKVKVEDWSKLKDLLKDLVQEKPPVALELEPLIMKGEQWLAQFPKGNLGYFVVATTDHSIIGFCYVAVPTYYKPLAYIGIAIRKECRRQDIGSQMFYEIAQWAAGKQIQYLVADVWEWNIKSITFFEHLGFVEKSRFKAKYEGEDKEKVRLVRGV
jgi:RimJ/RimL family protein N-acetyltransferase